MFLRRVLRRAIRYVDKLCPDWDKISNAEVNLIHSILSCARSKYTHPWI